MLLGCEPAWCLAMASGVTLYQPCSLMSTPSSKRCHRLYRCSQYFTSELVRPSAFPTLQVPAQRFARRATADMTTDKGSKTAAPSTSPASSSGPARSLRFQCQLSALRSAHSIPVLTRSCCQHLLLNASPAHRWVALTNIAV